MGDQIQFVDSVSATATIRMSLSLAPWRVLFQGTDVSPPPFRRAVNSTLLADGAVIPASAYDNRVVRLHLQLDAADRTVTATQLQILHRELDRPTNILRWQPDPALPPVYFRTFRAPDYDPTGTDHGINLFEFVVAIPAAPFALGHRVDVTPVAVSNDPNASNGRFMDITGVTGDVETPLRISIPGSSVVSRQSLISIRRRGTPSAMPFVLQAESMTQGTDTSVTGTTDSTGGGASPSGAASNSCATTFATVNTMTPARLSTTAFPATPSVDARGTYRVFVRVRPGTAAAVFSIRLQHGIRAILNSAVTTAVTTTTYTMVDLGLVQIPEGVDPVTDGPGGLPLVVVGVPLTLYAQRLSGSGSLIWDYILAVPADDRLGIISWGSTTPTNFVVDSASRSVYGVDASGRIADIGSIGVTSDFPMVSPGVTNRLVYVNDVTPNPSSDAVSTTVTLTCSFWPQYLTVRPVST